MTPRRVYILDPDKLKIDSFSYDEPGPLPDVVIPPEKDEPKDSEPPKPPPKPS